MRYFVNEDSIVRKIWSSSDTILFIFAGSSAEFALNKAVDWLYFTGKLPADPIGRLFSTVSYAQQIVFSEYDTAISTIDKISAIHKNVEQTRGAKIPDWAYRDVLFMLIDYSIRSYELLQRRLSENEKEEVFQIFYQMGKQMDLTGLPSNFSEWSIMRVEHLQRNLEVGKFTINLYEQYKRHLGFFRYNLLLQAQKLVVPPRVNYLLKLGKVDWLVPVLQFYKFMRIIKVEFVLKRIILPKKYIQQILDLDRPISSQ